MNALNAAQRMQMIEKFETLTMSEYETLVSVNEQLRQRVQELEELLKESYKDADEVLRPRVAELEKERDALLEANRIACEDLVERHDRIAELKQQRDELVEHLENILFWDNGKPEFDDARAAIASVKEK